VQPTTDQISQFISKWKGAPPSERAHAQSFMRELCALLEVPAPEPAPVRGKEVFAPLYGFERAIRVKDEPNVKFIDLYRADCFIWENKQLGGRGTSGWLKKMEDAFQQAARYARGFATPRAPFLVTCDIGHVFEVWSDFSRQGEYGGYAARKTVPIDDLAKEEVRTWLRTLWLDPMSLDPAREAARVTWEVAEYLAKLASELEQAGHAPEAVAKFLMRCLFTMFAEDIKLIKDDSFTTALGKTWVHHPEKFERHVVAFWQAMDQGGTFGDADLLRFNGGLFHAPSALPLTGAQLEELLRAAKRNWSAVEPSIFGTLLERALDERKRAELGAHFTPRAYIERLVIPTVIEPLREDWKIVLAQVRRLTRADVPSNKDKAAAVAALREFHRKLCGLRVLDPACGSGNFLYVTYDLLKRLESEVLRELYDLSRQVELITILPSQFLGLERNVRAREVADLVLWIGHLQWRYRQPDAPVREPVLEEYKNIVAQDAVLAWDRQELVRDERGKPRLIWDMHTTTADPVTGRPVPDTQGGMVPMYSYTKPRAPEWPEADFIVGNPPFIGANNMRKLLGDGYSAALNAAWPHLSSNVDLVMYWWDRAASLVRQGKVRRFGFITTNSIVQQQNRAVMEPHVRDEQNPLSIVFAIADHPWVINSAAVRIGMTVGALASNFSGIPRLGVVTAERLALADQSIGTIRGDSPPDSRLRGLEGPLQEFDVELQVSEVQTINSNLTAGADVTAALPLKSNGSLTSQGVKLSGKGFRIQQEDFQSLGLVEDALPQVVRSHTTGRGTTQGEPYVYVIDFFGVSAEEARTNYPSLYARVLETVKPERDQNKDAVLRTYWWQFGRTRPNLRMALRGLSRFIITPETSKHRVFTFVEASLLPDHSLYAVALDKSWHLGVLSSRPQTVWSLAAGATLEDRPRWRNGTCFDPFPFPEVSPAQEAGIGRLAEQLDAHRRDAQARDPKAHLTAQYNALVRLREAKAGGTPLTEAERAFHQRALTGVLAELHDALDAAVCAAYGWPVDLSDEALLIRLVALNAARAAEEAQGTVRYLRPSLQAPAGEQLGLTGDTGPEDGEAEAEDAATAARPWPKEGFAQFTALRDVILSRDGLWPLAEISRAFKGARPEELALLLDILSGQGVVVPVGEPRVGWRRG
jgi:hypothetical protein